MTALRRRVPLADAAPLLLASLLAACAAGAPEKAARVAPAAPEGPPWAFVQRSLETLPSGGVADWEDVAAASSGTVRPVRTFRAEGGGFCRECALTLVRADGSGRSWRETACRDPAGFWRSVASET